MKIDKTLAFSLGICLLITSVLLYVKYLYPYASFEQILHVMVTLTPDVIRENISLKDYLIGLAFFAITEKSRQQVCILPLSYLSAT